MEIPNYPSSKNSLGLGEPAEQKPKEPETVSPIHKGEVKKTKWQEFMSAFFEEDISNVKEYIVKEVLIKGVKDLIFEGIRVFFYPRGGGRGGVRRGGTSYDKYYDEGVPFKPSSKTYMPRSAVDFSGVSWDQRYKAQDVLDAMVDYIDQYGRVTVARMYDFAEMTPPNTSHKFGWYSLNGAEVMTLPGGRYGLHLPKPQPIN